MGINCSEPVVLSTGRTCALAGFLPCGCSSGPFPEVFPFPLLACSLASALTASSDGAVQPVCSTRVCFSTSCFTVILFQDVSPYPCLSFLCLRMRAESLQSCLTLCNPMDCSLPGSCVHGDSLGKNTGVNCHALLQGIFPTWGSNPHLLWLLHCRWILYC